MNDIENTDIEDTSSYLKDLDSLEDIETQRLKALQESAPKTDREIRPRKINDKFKDLNVKDHYNLGDVMAQLQEEESGLDRVRSVLAMRMNQYNSISLTSDDTNSISKAFRDIETGSATNLVCICKKSDCLYLSRCALYVADKCPEGFECLHENYILTQAMHMYLQSLDIDINNYPEMVLVNQLVEYELIEYRCNSILSNSHKDLRMESVVGIDQQGRVVTKEEISHALSIKMQIFKNKKEILESFTATRREQYKKQAALKEVKAGPAKMLSQLKSKMKNLQASSIQEADVYTKLDNPLSMD